MRLNHDKHSRGDQQWSHGQESDALTLLTAAKIKRVREGLAAARSHAVRHRVQMTLEQLAMSAKERPEPRVSGELRRLLLRSLLHSLFRISVEHPEHLPQQPAILVSNHLNHIDPLLLLSEIPAQPYYYVLGDARTLYNRWWKRQILRLSSGVIPLERRWKEEVAVMERAKAGCRNLVDLAAALEQNVPSGGDIRTLRQIDRVIQALLERGDGLILFPEGRLGAREGRLHLPLKRGTAIYALRTRVPIVPVVLIGTRDLYLGKELTIRFGEPLSFPESKRPQQQEVEQVLEALQHAFVTLLPHTYHEPKGPKPLRYCLNHILY